jgi:hypothetical protein
MDDGVRTRDLCHDKTNANRNPLILNRTDGSESAQKHLRTRLSTLIETSATQESEVKKRRLLVFECGMNKLLVFSRSQFISPSDPILRIDTAIGCDGSECGLALPNEDGSLDDLPPHYHLVESQMGAGTRSYPLGGPIPEVHYETSHN